MNSQDEIQAQLTGSLIAVRLVVAALVRTHPAPEQLLQEIRSLMDTRAELKERLPAPIEAAFNERLHEFTSYARMGR